jgi:hypothetical protein
MGTPTFTNISPVSRGNGGGGGSTNVVFDTSAIVNCIAEGFKKDLGEITNEFTDAIENHGAIICKEIDDAYAGADEHLKNIDANVEYLAKHGTQAIEDCAISVKEISNALEDLIKEMKVSAVSLRAGFKELNLKADIPMSQVTVGLPRGLVLSLVISPLLTGLVLWALLKFSSL